MIGAGWSKAGDLLAAVELGDPDAYGQAQVLAVAAEAVRLISCRRSATSLAPSMVAPGSMTRNSSPP